MKTILAMMACCLFGLLGTWQLVRFYEKKNILEKIDQIVTIDNVNNIKEIKSYSQIKIRAIPLFEGIKYLYSSYNGQWGYYLLVPIRLADQSTILVNGGFIRNIDQIQDFIISNNLHMLDLEQEFTGIILPYKQSWWQIQDINYKKHNIVTYIDHAQFNIDNNWLFIVRGFNLLPEMTIPKVQHWFTNNHLGYFIQWYILAFIMLIFAIYTKLKKL